MDRPELVDLAGDVPLLSAVKTPLKRAIAAALYRLGVLRMWQTLALRRKAVVLMYHRVLTDEEWKRTGSHPGIVVTHETFARQMALLKRRFRVLSIREFADHLERRIPFDDSSCVITFDDGWRDNVTNAWPVLKKFDLPAVVFLPVNFVGEQRIFWREALTHALVKVLEDCRASQVRTLRYRALLEPFGLGNVLSIAGADSRSGVAQALDLRPDLRASVAEELLARLAAEFDISVDAAQTPDQFMAWGDVVTLSQNGMAFGGHGSEHERLGEIPADQARADIEQSKTVLDSRCSPTLPVFSYPNGDWSPAVARSVEEAGYRLAFTTEPGSVRCEDFPFGLRRVNVHEDATSTPGLFLARLTGLL